MHKFSWISFKFTVDVPKIVQLTGIDVPDECIRIKNKFKHKMDKFQVYFNNYCIFAVSVCVLGVQPSQLEWQCLRLVELI